jgi:hypothetical protein
LLQAGQPRTYIEFTINVCRLTFTLITTLVNDHFINGVMIWYSFKFLLKVGVEESIVNAPLISLQSKNTSNAKSDVRFKQLIRDP